ncbi:MAG: hypothetical protein ACSHWW_10930 [Nonlabens sp.]|uniref:hypothetical protein n=1 Tax=Nonlabens sp. TaxID=1888209 RepID=UPI003EF2C510
MNHVKIIALILCGMTASLVVAQKKYKATYDYQSDQLLYFELDNANKIIDTLNGATLKRGSIIMIEVDNVNPFALSIETTVEEESLHETSGGFNFAGLLGNIQNISGGSLAPNMPELPAGDFENFDMNGARGSANTVEELEKLTTNLRALKTSLLSDMRNPNLSKEQILKNLKYLASLNDDDRLPDPEDNLYFFLETLESLIRSDGEKLNATINSTDNGSSRGATAKRALRSYTEYNVDAVDEVTDLYASVEAASFNQVYDYRVTADRAVVEIKFIPISEKTNAGNNTAVKIRSIPIKARGGFKINTGVALTLNNFKDSSKDYYIDQNGLIGATANDKFVPNLSTMINFYPIMGENFNIGGSFGLSIPIADDLRGVNFLIGPSVFFGNKNRFSFSGGVAFGPVQELTNGLQEGDAALGNDIDGFTKNVYDVGFYMGISFSLFDLN